MALWHQNIQTETLKYHFDEEAHNFMVNDVLEKLKEINAFCQLPHFNRNLGDFPSKKLQQEILALASHLKMPMNWMNIPFNHINDEDGGKNNDNPLTH